MTKIYSEPFMLAGLSLKSKTTNSNGQSAVDCGNLWQKFESESISAIIPGKLSDAIYAVYHQYEGDHTQPFSYFIGCPVKPITRIPESLDIFTIPAGTYIKITTRGKMPDCIADAWRKIWNSSIPRSFRTDYELYDDRSKDRNDAEVDLFISVK